MSYNILVVDDEKELADVIELYLTADGCTVHKCYTGKEALMEFSAEIKTDGKAI